MSLLTINTHKRLYQFNRLPFGVSSAPSIFQQNMDQILIHIKNVSCYLDDIIVAGKDEDDCKKTLCVVFQRVCDHNVKTLEHTHTHRFIQGYTVIPVVNFLFTDFSAL